MNLKRVLLDNLQLEQLKELCTELEVETDRRSRDAMVASLVSAKHAKPERLVEKLTVSQLKGTLAQLSQPTDGKRDDLVSRLLEAGGRSWRLPSPGIELEVQDPRPAGAWAPEPTPSTRVLRTGLDVTEQYRHADQAVQRPDVGVQDQFQARRPAKTYRYDSSLDPALSWDEQRERDLGEWLLGLVVRAAKEGETAVFAEPQLWRGGGVRVGSLADAAQMLQQISKPFLNWAGKAERPQIQVPTAPLFVHERHSTKAILDGIRHRKARGQTMDLFGDVQMDIRENLEAYEHKGPWQNRMILGDSLSVMNSLLEFEGMAGQVQMIYIDPPYGVRFGSNFQPFVRKREVKHGDDEQMTREPEMVKAYRDTWELGLHSYLTYLRDRLLIARELLTESGSMFVQISDENLHHVRELMDSVLGPENFCNVVDFQKSAGQATDGLPSVSDYIVWYAKDRSHQKFRKLYEPKTSSTRGGTGYTWLEQPDGSRRKQSRGELDGDVAFSGKVFSLSPLTSSGFRNTLTVRFEWEGETYYPGDNYYWKVHPLGLAKLGDKGRCAAPRFRSTSI